MTLTNSLDALGDHFGIVAFEIRGFLVTLAIAADQMRKALLKKRQENLRRAGLQKQRSGAEGGSSIARGRRAYAIQALFAVVDQRHHGMRQDAYWNPGLGELFNGFQTQRGTGRARLDQTGQALIERRNGEMH